MRYALRISIFLEILITEQWQDVEILPFVMSFANPNM